jgi:hypothetical protein
MCSRLLKDQRYRVLVKVKDARASTQAVAFGKRLEHPIDRLLIGVKASKDTVVLTSVRRYDAAVWGAHPCPKLDDGRSDVAVELRKT